jgi:hypothetical protein
MDLFDEKLRGKKFHDRVPSIAFYKPGNTGKC